MSEEALPVTQEQAATATATLAERQKNPEWNAKLVSMTDGYPEKREFAKLMDASSRDTAKGESRLDKIIAGKAQVEMGEVTTSGEISTANAIKTVETLRDAGLTDPQIKQALSGAPVSKAEYEAVRIIKSDRLGNREWTQRYLAGGAQERREMLLINTIISNGYVGQERTR
jgi:hypothetical protein